MDDFDAKSDLVYDQTVRTLQLGKLLPGDRISAMALSQEFGISLMPVRFAVRQMLKERLIERYPHGLRVPIPSEFELRTTYDSTGGTLLLACDSCLALPSSVSHRDAGGAEGLDDPDIVARTCALFTAIVIGSTNPDYVNWMRCGNARLGPLRRAKLANPSLAVDDDPEAELSALCDLWRQRALLPLKAALKEYYARRSRMAPHVAASLRWSALRRAGGGDQPS